MDEKQTSTWIVAATVSSFVLLLAVGGVFALRDRLFAQARMEASKQTAEREKLSQRIDALANKADQIAALAKPDTAPIDALTTQLTATNAKLDEASKRIDGLEKELAEKKAEPAPVAAPSVSDAPTSFITTALSGAPFAEELAAWKKSHPAANDSLAPIAGFAETGIPSERALSDQLRAALDAIPVAKDEEPNGFVQKINTHLEGLVKIKKTAAADPYAPLRAHVLSESYGTVLREVEQLPGAQRAPLNAWLTAAHERAAAISALTRLAGQVR